MKRGLLILAWAISAAACPASAADGPPRSGTLRWTNGEAMPGDLIEATGTTATWQSPLFEQPVVLGWDAIRRMDWPADTAPVNDPFIFNLRDGSSIHGDLVAVTGSSVLISGSRCGDIEFQRSEVLSARRIKGTGLVLAGPSGDIGWEPAQNAAEDSAAQAAVDNGNGTSGSAPLTVGTGEALQIPYWNRGARLDVELPDSVDVEFHLHASGRPDFRLFLGTEPDGFIQIETWGDEIVIDQSGPFEMVRKIEEGEHDLGLRLCWNRKTGHCSVFTPAGDLITTWVSGTYDGLLKGGVHLQNKGRDLTLDFLRIRKWDGSPPPKIDVTRPRVELADGRILEGKVTSGSDGSIEMRGEAGQPGGAFALKDVDAVIFSPDSPRTAPAAETLSFADGSSLRGRLLGIKDGRATLAASFSARPLVARLDALRQLLVNSPPDATPLSKVDTLRIQQTTFHGTFVAAGDDSPRWLPAGGVAPVLMSGTVPYEIARFFPEDAPSPGATALFYTRAGDVLPGNLHALDRTGAEFDSGITAVTKLPADELEAIQFGASGQTGLHGFTNPGWRVIAGDDSKVRRTGDSIEMDPGSSIENSAAMQSSEIRFGVKLGGGLWAARLRLFCSDAVSRSKSTNLLIACNGNQIMCGTEATEGQFNDRIDAAAPSGSVTVRLMIRDRTVDVYLNGKCVEKVPASPSSRAGPGLIIEPAALWGNAASAITLSDFSMRSSPGSTWLPNVDADAKAQALTIPRFRRDDPPAHALIAANGDVLRGEIEAATNTNFGFRSGMDELVVPRDRVKAVIWLGKPTDTAPTPAPENPTLKLLDQELTGRIMFGGGNLATYTSYLQNAFPGLKFKLPDDMSRGGGGGSTLMLGGETVASALDKICALYGFTYQVDDQGVIVIGPAVAPADPLMEKIYWLKPGSFPANDPAGKILAGKGITFPPGASAAWVADAGQLTMKNTAENQAQLSQVLAANFGGTIGSPTHWLVLTSGARIALAVDKFGPDTITGWHPLYGRCTVPTADIAMIRTSPLEPSAAMQSVADWHPVYAPEPVLSEAGGDSTASIGTPAASFKLALLDGGKFDLADEKGKIVVLDFWATWCGPCVRSLPGLVDSMAGFSPDRVKFVGVNEDEPAGQVKQFLETRGLNLTVALDDGGHVGQQYGADAIPHTVIIGPDGKIAWVKTGYTPGGEGDAAKEVNQLLAAPAPH